MRTNLVRVTAVFGLISVSAACYNHRPIPLAAVAPNQDVRLVVTRVGAGNIAQVREIPGAAPTISGKLIGQEGGDLLLRIPIGQRTVGFLSEDLEQTVRIPSLEVLQVEQREFDGVRTGLFIGGIAGATALLLLAIIEAGGEGSPTGETPPPPESRIPLPLFSIPIGR